MSEDRTIYTDNGDPIPYFYGNLDDYLDKTVLIFGASGQGKSTFIDSILYMIKDYIPNYLIVAPDTSAKPYRKKVPARCIKENLTKDTLIKIWERQTNITQVYNIANDIDILASLFNKSPSKHGLIQVKAICYSASKAIQAINNNTDMNFAQKKSQTSHIEELQAKKIKMLYKTSIRDMRSKLERLDLTDKESICLKYLDINPRLMIIIDDCSTKFELWMKMFPKKEGNTNPIEKIFYRGRHNFISLIFAAHDDKVVSTSLRKNARVTVYCGSKAVMASLNKTGGGFTPQDKKLAQRMSAVLFRKEANGADSHKKLCYLSTGSSSWQYHIADLYPEFSLGCDPLRKLTKKMPKIADNLLENPFLKSMIKSDDKPKKKRQPRYARRSRR